jgi:hypothetical protein
MPARVLLSGVRLRCGIGIDASAPDRLPREIANERLEPYTRRA